MENNNELLKHYGHLPNQYKELIFTILDSLDDEVSGAKAHAIQLLMKD